MNKETIIIKVARHIPSDCLLINGKWEIDYTDEDILTGGQDNYEDYVEGLFGEYDEGYDADDCEQEHCDDYIIDEREFTIEYTDEQREQYEQDKSDFESRRDNYYGYCMNGNNGRREFSKMYGDGEYISIAQWLHRN